MCKSYYLYLTENQQSAEPIVFVGPVEELQTTIPVSNHLPISPHSRVKFERAGTRKVIFGTAVWPFVGNTSTTQKFNLKNPADNDAAFRLEFVNGGTHALTGYTGDGSTTHVDTKWNPDTRGATTSGHMSIYIRTNTTGGTSTYDMGAARSGVEVGGATISARMDWLSVADRFSGAWGTSDFNSTSFVSNSDSRGFYGIGRTASGHEIYKNGSLQDSDTNASGTATRNVYISALHGATGNPTGRTDRQYAFASVGIDTLSSAEWLTLYTIVQQFQTYLGRAV